MSLPPVAPRIAALPPYPFAEVDRLVAELKEKGIPITDFGVGDPVDPTPEFIRQAAKDGLDSHAKAGYPSYIGRPDFRAAAADFYESRFGVSLDPNTQICSTVGSKEAVFHFPLAYISGEQDIVISPTPGYPPYTSGTNFAGGTNFYLPLTPQNGFLPEFSKVPAEVAARAKIMWVNSPSNPCGSVADGPWLRECAAWCRQHNIILASDECYTEIFFDEGAPPPSALQAGTDGIISFFSLSKGSCMTGYRVGFVAGDAGVVEAFKKVKTNIDSGTPNAIQSAAMAALKSPSHMADMRKKYAERRDVLLPALEKVGCTLAGAEATFYVWAASPAGMTGVEFAKKLLSPEVAVAVTPGAWISEQDSLDGQNPGEDFVRFALVPTAQDTAAAAARIVSAFSA